LLVLLIRQAKRDVSRLGLFAFVHFQSSRRSLYTHPVPVYTFAYNSYRNSLTPLLIKVGIVGTNAYNVGTSAPNSGGDVSKSSQVRSTYFGMIQVWATGGCCVREGIGWRVVVTEVRGGL
jgi:hypothetical protein